MLKKRQINLDLLRIISIFLVIIIHVCSIGIASFSGKMNFGEFSLILIDSIARCSVPIFIMLSGYFMLSKKRIITYKETLDKSFKLIISLIVFSCVYIGFSWYLNGKPFSLIKIIEFFLAGKYIYHFWFIYMIIGLYLISPLLQKIVKHIKLEDFKYYAIITLVVSSIIPTVLKLNHFKKYAILQNFEFGFFNIYLLYFLLGYYLLNYKLSDKNKKKLTYLGIVSLITTCLLTAYFTFHGNKFSSVFFEYYAPNIIVYSIFVFVWLSDVLKKIKYNSNMEKIITNLSKLTFGIYLIHMMIINFIVAKKKSVLVGCLLKRPFISTFLFSIFVFTISSFIAMVISKIPIVNKYLIYYNTKKGSECNENTTN